MGREIRMVPPNWEHPKDESGRCHPMFDEEFLTAAREWLDACISWGNGTHPRLIKEPELREKYPFYWQYDSNPPNEEYYLPHSSEAKTWFQVYETVSEGTPVTPPFATKEELIDYLVKIGDDWDSQRGSGGWSRKNAESFVNKGWAPSGMVEKRSDGSVRFFEPRDMGDL